MLRCVLLCVRQQYMWTGPLLQPALLGSGGGNCMQGRQLLHTSCICRTLDKDAPHKKSGKTLTDETNQQEEIGMDEFRPGSLYPTIETAGLIVNGTRFDELPIVHIKATKNNTHVVVTNGKGQPITQETGGSVGFRNARKGTNIAAQAAAVALGEKAVSKGVTNVRVSLKGIGPGRMAAVKGLQMAGMSIVSITEATPIVVRGQRPKKQRRL